MEDLIVSDFQRLDAGFVAFLRFQAIDKLLGIAAGPHNFIHRRLKPRPDHAARLLAVLLGGAQVVRGAQQRRRVVVDRSLQEVQHVGAGVERCRLSVVGCRLSIVRCDWPLTTDNRLSLVLGRVPSGWFSVLKWLVVGCRLSVVNGLFAPIAFAEQVVVVARRRVAAGLALLAQTRLYPLSIVRSPLW